MKKKLLSLVLLLCLSVGSSAGVTNTAVAETEKYVYTASEVQGNDVATYTNPVNFNGSWLSVPGYGGAEDTSNTVDSVNEQKELYKYYKKEGHLIGVLEHSFWTWVQGWALFNYGKELAQNGNYDTASLYLKNAIRLSLVEAPINIPEKYRTEFERQSNWVRSAASSYLLYCERNLGIKPWPKKSK